MNNPSSETGKLVYCVHSGVVAQQATPDLRKWLKVRIEEHGVNPDRTC